MTRKGTATQSPKPTPLLLAAASDASADMLYFSGVFVPDPFLALAIGGRRIGVLSKLERQRVEREGRFDEVLEWEPLRDRAVRDFPKIKAPMAAVAALLAKQYRVTRFRVPWDFPVGLAWALQTVGVAVDAAAGACFPEREIKDAAEAQAIRQGNGASAAGLKVARKVLQEAVIRGRKLYWRQRVLTSERLRRMVDQACLEHGAVASRTICAGGDQACDPHCVGSGPLRPHELIIVDVFPRVTATGYHGDMTRTFLKGTPNDAQQKLVAAVREAQRQALAAIRPGVALKTPHAAVERHFERCGYKTECVNGTWRGFFHSTGHGLGLDVHEAPRIAKTPGKFRRGMVVTVEPGLYYPGLGGCRIEDVVRVVPQGIEYLSRSPYNWVVA